MSDPPYLKALKGEMPFQKNGLVRWYKKAFIDTGSMKPIFHVVFGVMAIGYVMDFARHLRRACPPPPARAPAYQTCPEPAPTCSRADERHGAKLKAAKAHAEGGAHH